MWNALRSDLQEFVSTVTEDTSNVLSTLDSGLNQGGANDDSDAEEDTPKREVNHAELKEIMTLLRDHPGTYTEALVDEDDTEGVEEYLKEFSIEAKTDAIAEVLKNHEDTVKKQFEELCPTQVTYEEFWKRYFYRCDEDRIAKQLQEETERARQARAEAIEAGVKTVTNFFGGAVAAVTKTIAPEGGDPQQEGINFFGAKGRPPFVMNTAVSESGDDADAQDDDDEEEELGWDDDDDDDFDQEEEGEEDTATEQIEFTDQVSEDLQEKLKQAIEERDQIKQTVDLQAAEIKSLQQKLSGSPDIGSGAEVEELKLKLFEKDSELAALKARNHDDHMEDGGNKLTFLAKELGSLPADQLEQLKAEIFGISDGSNSADTTKIASLEKQVQQLSKILDTKEAALKAANDKLVATTKNLEASRSELSRDQASAQNANSEMKALEAKVKATQQKLDAAQSENEQLRKSAEAAQEASASQVSSLKQELTVAQQKTATLTKQAEEAAQKLKESEAALQKTETELAAAKRGPTPPTPDSVSTGVKVESPTFSTPMTATRLDVGEDDDEEDGWGDDWD